MTGTIEIRNYNDLLEFTGKSNIHKKEGRGTLQVSLNGIFLLGGDTGVNDEHTINKFIKFEFTEEGSKIVELPMFPFTRSCCTSELLGNYLYIIGGYSGKHSLSDVQRFDFLSNEWETVAPLTYRKASLSSVVYKNKIYVVGGVQGPRASDEIECYDDSVNKWNIVGYLQYKRSGCGIGLFENKIFVFGGISTDTKLPLEIFDMETKTSVIKEEIIIDLHSFGIALLHDDDNVPYFLIAGGGYERSPSNNSYLYNIREGRLEVVSPLHDKRQYIRLCKYNGQFYAIGGYDGNDIVSNSEFFDMKTRKWIVRESFFPYCGYAAFTGDIKMKLKSYWKENMLNGKSIINDEWKGTYHNNKKNGLFTNLRTGENAYFIDNFQVTKSQYDACQKMKKIKIPENFLCPISYEIMLDPVVTSSGSTYDRKNIVKWLANKRTDPMTRDEISTTLTPNKLLKKIILSFLEEKKIFL